MSVDLDKMYVDFQKELKTPGAEHFSPAWNSVCIIVTNTYMRVWHQNKTYGELVADYTFIFPKNQAQILWQVLKFIKGNVKPFKGTSLEFSYPVKIEDPEIIIKNMNTEQRRILVKTLNNAGLSYEGNEVSFSPEFSDGEM